MRPAPLLLLLVSVAAAQDPRQVAERFLAQEEEAFRHYHRQDWPAAVAAFERQIAIYKDNPRPYYNIACCYGLQADAGRAATWLSLAIAHGWRDAEHLGKDPDFDLVRQSPEHLACLAQLARARRLDPDPEPRLLPLASVPPAGSFAEAASESEVRRVLLEASRRLHEVHQWRKELFEVLDRKMARLARYIAENGDAKDAAMAAHERVRLALLYLQEAAGEAEADRRLARITAAYVVRTAEEFLRGWPGDASVADILYAQAHALRRLGRAEDAERALRSLQADHPGHRLAAVVDVELCALLADLPGRVDDLRREYEALRRRRAGDERAEQLMRLELTKARLLAEGMPNVLDLDPKVAERVQAHDGPLLYVCVAHGDARSEELLRALPAKGALPVVLVVDPPGRVTELDLVRWLRDHAHGMPAIARAHDAVERLWLRDIPTVILARKDGTVLAVDPAPDELAGLLAQAR